MNKSSPLFSIGLMSGTSMDGIDAAIIETDGAQHIQSVCHIALPYAAELKMLLKATEYVVKQCQGDLALTKINFSKHFSDYCQRNNFYLNHEMCFDKVVQMSTELHVLAVEKLLQHAKIRAEQIQVIGYHGQTLLHQPLKNISIQIGNASFLAAQTNICVVSQFRQNDLIHGGQGAPFAPIYHQALCVRDNLVPVTVVNCGGIANVTYIQGNHYDEMLGFDTGPGNVLLDRFVRQRTCGKEFIDQDGQYGLKGQVHEDLLSLLYQTVCYIDQQNYFSIQPPKSLDVNDLSLPPAFDNLSIADGCSTLAAFTARTILDSVDFISSKIDKWILAGGGWNNPVICRELISYAQQKFSYPVNIMKCAEVGWHSTALEAELFAYLAVRCLRDLPISFPKTTGVLKPVGGGKIYRV